MTLYPSAHAPTASKPSAVDPETIAPVLSSIRQVADSLFSFHAAAGADAARSGGAHQAAINNVQRLLFNIMGKRVGNRNSGFLTLGTLDTDSNGWIRQENWLNPPLANDRNDTVGFWLVLSAGFCAALPKLAAIREDLGLEHLDADGQGVAHGGDVASSLPGHDLVHLIAGQAVGFGKGEAGDAFHIGVEA